VADGRLEVDEARRALEPYTDLGFAKLDLEREARTGLPEAVFGEGKAATDLVRIVAELVARKGRALVTRLDPERAAMLAAAFPEGEHHERAGVFAIGRMAARRGVVLGGTDAMVSRSEGHDATKTHDVVVLAAGTSDLAVAEEAAVVAEWLGLAVARHYDVGIAGVRRLLDRLGSIRSAEVVIAVAGMDGALPTLVAGLVAAPVVAVPTSVGYGSGLGGVAALLTMLNACAPGVAVVNIDNGYGAAALAARMIARSRGALASDGAATGS
jgi:NCAIR mutase (PurE)-related protein